MSTTGDESKVKLLLASPYPPPEGGIATWTQRILKTKAFQSVHIRHMDTSLSGGHTTLRGPKLRRALRSTSLIPKFLWLCLFSRPDVIHVAVSGFPGYYRDMAYVLIAWILRIKIILNLRYGDTDLLGSKMPRLLKPLVFASMRSAWCVAPLSQPMSDTLHDLNIRKVQVMPNCIDVDPEPKIPATNSEDDQFMRLLYVGWVVPAKGVKDVLDALQRVEGVNLRVIGPVLTQYADGNKDWALDLVKEKGIGDRVEFAGGMETSQTRKAYAQSDALVLASHIEGFPNVILEAMEAGIPTIATRVGAVPEIIRDGHDGYLINVHDVEALANRMADLRDNPDKRRKMGQQARERVIENYSAESIARKWVKLYQDAANNHRTPPLT